MAIPLVLPGTDDRPRWTGFLCEKFPAGFSLLSTPMKCIHLKKRKQGKQKVVCRIVQRWASWTWMQVSFDGIWQRCWGWTVGTSATHTCRLAWKIVTLSTKTSHSAKWPQQGACLCCIILLYSCLVHHSADRNFVQVENSGCVCLSFLHLHGAHHLPVVWCKSRICEAHSTPSAGLQRIAVFITYI